MREFCDRRKRSVCSEDEEMGHPTRRVERSGKFPALVGTGGQNGETMNRHEEMRRAAETFHTAHPEVYKRFTRYTFELIDAGHRHGSASAVFERIRWQTLVGGTAPELKLNNNYRAFYARWFHEGSPLYAGFFRNRVQTSQKAPARGPEPTRDSFALEG